MQSPRKWGLEFEISQDWVCRMAKGVSKQMKYGLMRTVLHFVPIALKRS